MPMPSAARNYPSAQRHDQPSIVTSRPADTVEWCAVALWLSLSLLGLWRYQAQAAAAVRERIFEVSQPALVENWFKKNFASPAGNAVATVVSISAAACACYESAAARRASVSALYTRRGVRFVEVDSDALSQRVLAGRKAGNVALIFDRQGRLSYYGPYAETASCGTGTGLIEPVLDRILSGRTTTAVPVLGPACACT